MQDSIAFYLPSLLKASWQSAVLILLVLAVQWAFGPRLKPRWRYLLWVLVMIRLALPGTIPSSVSLFNLLNFTGAAASSDGLHATPIGPSPAGTHPTAAVQTKPDGVSARQSTVAALRLSLGRFWLLGLWLAGASALAVYLLATHRRLSKRVATFRPLVNPPVLNLLEDCKQQMSVRVPITVVETTEVGSPALFGFIRPRLLLPAGLTQSFSLDELRYVFLHELSHIKRHDILVGWLMTGLQILHWFNPLVWLAFYRMRVDRELACDALALSYAREGEHQPYGRTIIKLLESFGRSTWAPSLAGAVEYANANTTNLVNHTFKFTVKIKGDTLTLIGIGNPWKEVWRRAKSDALQPLKSDSIPQGKWRGRESGADGTCSLVLNGSSLEFHGAETNEWYRATVSVYDTTPRQLVVAITDCPIPQYVGKTASAIYQLQDGKLTITGNEPGNPTVLAGFDASGARKLVFKRD